MWIEKVDLFNFRAFKGEQSLVLRPDLAVLVGLNGAGKSSVLDAVASILSGVISWISGGKRAWFGAGDESNIHLGESRSGWALTLRWEDTATATAALRAGSWTGTITTRSLGKLDVLRDSRDDASVTLPYLGFVHSSSTRQPVARGREDLLLEGRMKAYDGAFDSESLQFNALERWFELEENLENEQKIQRGNLRYELSSLRAVRKAVRCFMETLQGTEISSLRVVRAHRDGPLSPAQGQLVAKRGDQELFLSQLSDGERRLLLLVADAARRMVVLNPGLSEPLETPGVMLIDEVELHLHPQWQRTVVAALRAAFPRLQFILTTHAPAVLSTVQDECILVLQEGAVLSRPVRALGLDSNTILTGLMDTTALPESVQRDMDELYRLIEQDPDAATVYIQELERSHGRDHPELVRARALLDFMAG